MIERVERGNRAVILHPVFSGTGPDALDEFRELARSANVEVVEGSGLSVDFGPADGIYVNAGLTHPPAPWLERLRVAGRLLLPLSEMGGERYGAVLWVRRRRAGYEARFLSTETDLRIYPCRDGRSDSAEARLARAFADGGHLDVRSLRRDVHSSQPDCWLHAPDYCLSRAPLVGAD